MQTPSDHVETNRTVVTCPYCGSTDSEFFALFGQQLLTVQFYCHSCHTPFERIKDDDLLEAVAGGDVVPPTE